MSKYKDLIQQAKNTDNQQSAKPENKKAELPENKKAELPENQIKEPEVNLCIKVEKRLRQHWAAEAKRKGTTLKAVISKALEDELGIPE